MPAYATGAGSGTREWIKTDRHTRAVGPTDGRYNLMPLPGRPPFSARIAGLSWGACATTPVFRGMCATTPEKGPEKGPRLPARARSYGLPEQAPDDTDARAGGRGRVQGAPADVGEAQLAGDAGAGHVQ